MSDEQVKRLRDRATKTREFMMQLDAPTIKKALDTLSWELEDAADLIESQARQIATANDANTSMYEGWQDALPILDKCIQALEVTADSAKYHAGLVEQIRNLIADTAPTAEAIKGKWRDEAINFAQVHLRKSVNPLRGFEQHYEAVAQVDRCADALEELKGQP